MNPDFATPGGFARGDTLLAAIVESSDDAIIAKDLNGIIRSWNRGAERVFGYTAAEVIGKPVSILAPPDLNEMPKILARIRAGERVDHYETRRRRKDGTIITVSLTVSPLRDDDGTIIGASKIARDVTERRAIEDALRSTEHQLMLLVEASGALLASPNSPEVLRTILNLAQRFVSADAYSVWQRHDDGVWRLASSTGLSATFIESASLRVPASQNTPTVPMLFEDVERDPLLADRREPLLREGIRAMLAIPLNTHGKAAGTVVFYWKSAHAFSDSEVRIATALGNLAAAALATAELYEREMNLRAEAEASERRAIFLEQVGTVLASSLDYKDTLASVVRLSVPSFSDWACVDVIDDRGQLKRVAATHSVPEGPPLTQPDGDELALVALRTGKSVLMDDTAGEFPDRALGMRSIIVSPMVVNGRSMGVITFATAESGRRYENSHLQTAEEIARRAATAVQHAELYRNVRASEERYRSLVSATASVVFTRDPAGAFDVPQESWEAYTGQSWAEHRDFGWTSALHPNDRESVMAAWVQCRDAQTTYEAEARTWHASTGGYRHCVARAAPVRNADGSIREWIGTLTDVHERKVAEQERASALVREQEARQTAELLNRIGPVLVSELDRDRLIQSITDIATQLAGAQFGVLFYQGADERGDATTLFTLSGSARNMLEPADVVQRLPLFARTFRDKQVVRSGDIQNDGIGGGVASAARSYLAVPVVSRSGEVLGALLFGHEEAGVFTERHEQIVGGIAGQAAVALDNARLFTESQESRTALERSNEELRRANADLEQFAYSASHDLKEPLRMVAVYSQILHRKYTGNLDPQADEYLKYMIEGAQRMDMLVRDLLAYTKAVTSQEAPVTSTIDANAVLHDVLHVLKRALDESGAVVTAAPLPSVLEVHEIHLVQLLQNLIENALKYRADSPPQIGVTADYEGGMWKICVKDNGIGVPPQFAEQIFGIFRRLHPSDRYPGTGIGLAICQKIVHRYGGRIWVESGGEGAGSTFCFTLPGQNS